MLLLVIKHMTSTIFPLGGTIPREKVASFYVDLRYLAYKAKVISIFQPR